MSVKAMSMVWEDETFSPTDKLVMLSLADHAGEDGSCYPSIARLCLRTGFKERTIQTSLKRLVEAGFLSIEMNAGRRGSNLYQLHLTPAANAPRSKCTPPAANAPHPRSKCTPPPHMTADTPAGDAPKPLRTVREPSEVNKVRSIIAESIGDDLAQEFIRHRQKMKKPLTEFAAKLFIAELSKCADPHEATRKAILRGWQTVYPENGVSNVRNSQNQQSRDQALADEILDAARTQ